MSSSPDAPGFRRGVRLAVDWGKARAGVAACDADGTLAYPVETIPSRDEAAARRRLAELVREYQPIEVILGMPLALSGRDDVAAQAMTGVAQLLARDLPVPLRVFDERLTTAAAVRHLTSIDTRRRRAIVDQAAAAGILEDALSYERHTGTPPGTQIGNPQKEGEA